MNEKIGLILIVIGVLFDLFGCVGLVRLPDVYNRAESNRIYTISSRSKTGSQDPRSISPAGWHS